MFEGLISLIKDVLIKDLEFIKELARLLVAIIDKSAIWYGNINILGFHSIEDNLIRIKNIEIASEL